MDDEEATLEGQFYEFARLQDNKRNGETITLWRSDYWFRQCRIMDDRKVTMTDTGIAWFKYSKTELTFDEWYEFITDLCTTKDLNQEQVEFGLTNCGIPGTTPVEVPAYRTFFVTYVQKSAMVLKTELTFDEWYEFLTDVCEAKDLNQEQSEFSLTNCGIPGTSTVTIPQYRTFFDTFVKKSSMML